MLGGGIPTGGGMFELKPSGVPVTPVPKRSWVCDDEANGGAAEAEAALVPLSMIAGREACCKKRD